MNTKLLKLAKQLYSIRQYKLAERVFDLTNTRKWRNRDLLEDIRKEEKEQQKWKAIEEQHRLDRPELYSTEPSEFSYPEGEGDPSRRYEVRVLYPSFDEEGAPFFDEEEGVIESITVVATELEALTTEEKSGYLKILSKEPLYPKA